MRKYWLVILQACLSAALLWRLFGGGAFRAEAAQVLQDADAGWMLAGLGTALATESLCAVRWWLMLRMFGLPISLWRSFVYCGAGLFFSLALPGAAGGDAFRILYVLQHHPGRTGAAALSVLADRLCGLVALVVALGLALVLRPQQLPVRTGAVLGAAAALLGCVILLLFLWWMTSRRSFRAVRLPRRLELLRQRSEGAGFLFEAMGARPGLVAQGIFVSAAGLASHFTTYFCSAMAFRLPVTFGQIFTVMPVVDTLILLPVTLFGVGLRESLFNELLGGLFGVSEGAASLTSLGGFTLQVAVAMVGGLLLFVSKRVPVRGGAASVVSQK